MLVRSYPAFEEFAYNLLRIGFGLLFMEHGAQKMFGWLGGFGGPGGTAELFSRFGAAGVIEFFGGLLLVLGLFTRPVALITALEMAVAYSIGHLPRGLVPILNRGELTLLYLLGFIYVLSRGPGLYSLDTVLFRKREEQGDIVI